MCVVVLKALLLFLTFAYRISGEESDRDRILSNPFLQEVSSEADDNANDRVSIIMNNPFLHNLGSNNAQSQGERRVTFHNIEEYENRKMILERNPFLQGIADETPPRPNVVVFHESRPSHNKKPFGGIYLLSQFDSICGLTKPLEQSFVQLIAKGDTVTRHYPWLVAIYHLTRTNPNFLCGGTLISEKHMVSAAHCFPYPDQDEYQFVVSNDLEISNRIVREARQIVRHPGYRGNESDADIALVVFSSDIPLTDKITPICLWKEGINSISEVSNLKGLIVGWGNDENNQKSTALPKQALLPIIDYLTCIRDNAKFAGVVGHNSFCAGYKKDTGACPGDSGSGFIIERNDRWSLRGVVSATILKDQNICQITDFTAMTDVARYSSWIFKLVNG